MKVITLKPGDSISFGGVNIKIPPKKKRWPIITMVIMVAIAACVVISSQAVAFANQPVSNENKVVSATVEKDAEPVITQEVKSEEIVQREEQNKLEIESESEPESEAKSEPETEEVSEISENETEAIVPVEASGEYIGQCRITAYCACVKCCGSWANNRPLDDNGNPIVIGAAGEELVNAVSVAGRWPFGTKLKIDGFDTTFIVQDRTAQSIQERYNGQVVDIYISDHDACYDFLEGYPEWADVYIVD